MAPILAQARLARAITARPRSPTGPVGIERTGGACPIGAPGPREGGWNLLRVSEANHRPRRIQPRATERLRNAHLAGATVWPMGPIRAPVAECRAMTSTPHLHRARSAAVLALRRRPRRRLRPGGAQPDRVPDGEPAASAAPAPDGRPDVAPSAGRRLAGGASACAAAAPSEPRAAPPSRPARTRTTPTRPRYAEIEGQVSAAPRPHARQPGPAGDVRPRRRWASSSQESFTKDNPEALIDGSERLLKGLLLMPQDASLRDLYIEMLTSQVAGLYDDTTRRSMYVVTETGEIGPTEEITYAHEYTHALQDQAFDLSKVKGTETDQGDRALARTALIEGDATLLMSLWAQQHLTQAELLEAVGASDPASQAALDKLPAILRETLLFPYTQGLQMLLGAVHVDRRLRAASTPCSPTRPSRPSRCSTRTSSAPREAPIAVAFPDDLAARLGDGWCVALQDTLGELQLRILLADAAGVDSASAEAAAAGWGGDRVALIDGPDGASGRRPRHPLGHGRRRGRVRHGPGRHRPEAAGRRPERAGCSRPSPTAWCCSARAPTTRSAGSRTSSASPAEPSPAARPGATSTRAPRSPAGPGRSRASSSPPAPGRAASPSAPARPDRRPARRDRRRGTGSRARSRRR